MPIFEGFLAIFSLSSVAMAPPSPTSDLPLTELVQQCKTTGDPVGRGRLLGQLGDSRMNHGKDYDIACIDYFMCAQIGRQHDDEKLARDCATALDRCATKHPEFQLKSLWIAGEIELSFEGDLSRARDNFLKILEECRGSSLDCPGSVFWANLAMGIHLAALLQDDELRGMVHNPELRPKLPARPPSVKPRSNDFSACEYIKPEAELAAEAYGAAVESLAFECLERNTFMLDECEEDVLPLLIEARGYYGLKRARSFERQNSDLNLAWAYFTRGETEQSKRLLLSLGHAAESQYPEIRLWYHGLRLRLATQGMAPFNSRHELKKIRESVHSDNGAGPGLHQATLRIQWTAALWAGRALREMKMPDMAIEALREAEALVDRMELTIALGARREGYFAYFDASKRTLADLYYEASRSNDLLNLARWSQTRQVLYTAPGTLGRRSPSESMAVEELVRLRSESTADGASELECVEPSSFMPTPGVLDLGLIRSENGWIGLARDTGGITPKRFDARDIGPSTLMAFDQQISAASVIHIFQDGSRDRVRIDTLGWSENRMPHIQHGSPWAWLSAYYALPLWRVRDVRFSFHGKNPPPRRGDCSVFVGAFIGTGGQNDTLPQKIVEALEHVEWRDGCALEVAVNSDFNHATVNDGLARAEIAFIYAHGARDDEDDRGNPWSGYLERRDNPPIRVLSVEDIANLPQVPRQVVLAACNSGGERNLAPGAVSGLAQVLINRGADIVVATTESVNTCVAAALLTGMASELAGGAEDLALAFYRARRALAECSTAEDCPAMACEKGHPEILLELEKFFVAVRESPS